MALVYGGRSSEHAISCLSAGSVLAALDRDRYEVVPVGITQQGAWVLGPDDPAAFRAVGHTLPGVDPTGPPLTLAADPASPELVCLDPRQAAAGIGRVDVVLPLLHGPYGEDGTVQGLFELAGIPYVGSGVLASAASMDKEFMKLLLAARGLPVGPYRVVRRQQWAADPAGVVRQVAELGWPVFVKPARGGSSLGISRVTDPDGLGPALDAAHRHDPKAVVERELAGREIECGVLEGPAGGPAQASLPAEVHVAAERGFYDFEAKYFADAGTSFDVPANLDEAQTAAVRALAVTAFAALGCEGLARVDFFLTDDGLIVNELNTMPGFTPASMFPRMWAASGLDYPALVDRLLRIALERPAGLR